MPLDIAADDFRAKSYDVFISYKHLDAAIRDALVEALQEAKLTVWWDAKLVSGAWRPRLAERINYCKLVVALWSEQVAASPDEVRDEMAQARGLDRLMALRTDRAEIPRLFGEQNFMPFDGWADRAKGKVQLEAIVADVRRRIGAPTYQVVETANANTVSTLAAPPEFGDIPGAPDKLIGRDAELAMLREAWTSRTPNKVNAVVLHALGGAGKSALLRTFANELLAEGGGGASRIYGWSAYSQGSGEQKRADADSFISKALGDFGWQGELPKDPVQRGRELAKLIRKERVLLLLDGLEPLQDAPNVNKGRFKDKGLAELIKSLAAHQPGLVVVTTRQEVPELVGFGSVAINHELDQLPDQAGADLLVELGVHGRQRELEAAVHDLQGHALSVTLLGTYLAEVCGGDIRHRDQFNFADVVLSPEEQSELLTDKTIVSAKRVAKVMRGYLAQFEKLGQDAAAERALLNLLGLFDRLADGPAVGALLGRHIPGLTDELLFEKVAKAQDGHIKSRKIKRKRIPEAKRTARLLEAKRRLRKLRLLSKANPKDPQELDAHPVVRAFFAGRLAETAPKAAKAAHEILYRHYAAAAPDMPDTLEEMQPLFHAVQHGVKAGQVQEAFKEVLWQRILRGRDKHVFRVLAAFGPYLTAIAHFFTVPWRKPRGDIAATMQAYVLNDAAFTLMVLGRLSDSVEPRRAGLEMRIAQQDWADAAVGGGALTDTLLRLGRIAEAVLISEQAVEHADRSTDWGMRCARRTDAAQVLNRCGQLDRAKVLFTEAEKIQNQNSRQTYLYSFQGYQYGDLILARADVAEALTRGRYQLDLAERYLGKGLGLDDIGYAHLLIGRAQDALGDEEGATSLDAAVAGLRRAGMIQLLPEALLARVAHRRRRAASGETDLIEGMRADLAEVEDIAGEEMRLHLTDLALERARLALDVAAAFASPEAARVEAEAQTAKAAALIAETGYHRRDGELAELQKRLAAS